jgi:hypothetical protein
MMEQMQELSMTEACTIAGGEDDCAEFAKAAGTALGMTVGVLWAIVSHPIDSTEEAIDYWTN